MQSNPSSGSSGNPKQPGEGDFSGGGGGGGNGHKKRGRGDSPSSAMMSSRMQPGSGGGQHSHHSHGGHHHSSSSHHHHSHHHYKDQAASESKFYSLSSIDARDPLEQTLEEAYSKLQTLIISSTETQSSFNELMQFANQSKMHYDDVANALLYSLLTDPMMAPKCLRNLFLLSNVSFGVAPDQASASTSALSAQQAILINNLLNLATENYFKLQDQSRQQLMWLIKELVKARVSQFDKLLMQMLRNIQSGSLTDKNIWLAETMLDILYDQTTSTGSSGPNSSGGSVESSSGSLWIYAYNELMSLSVYTYLRLIADHSSMSTLSQLRQRETEFCVQILREKWTDCMLIGRDLVRLLQCVGRLPEFEALFRDLIQNPAVLSPHFAQLGGLLYLMRMPTKRRCLISRLTVDMERKIYFLITSVRSGAQKRYLDWFQKQYLQTPESQSLRVDLIRYICAVVHPTNEQLNAGLVPRWNVCAWLLNTCTNPIDLANLKLALFYDWLFYDAKKDNIMLIEPGILMLFNSMRLATQTPLTGAAAANISINLTSMSFDFLCRVVNNFHLPLREHILNGLMQAFKDSVDKRVIPSLQGFFAAPTTDAKGAVVGGCLDRDLRAFVQATFGNFFQTMSIVPMPSPVIAQQQQQLPSPSQPLSQTPPPSQQQSPQIQQQPPSVFITKPIVQQSSPGSPVVPDTMATSPLTPPAGAGVFQLAASSLFKQQPPKIAPQVPPPLPTNEDSNDITDIPMKTESQESLNQQATFSSDDEEVYETNSKQSAPIVPTKTPTPTAALSSTANQAATLPLSSLQAQLQQLIQRPNKLFIDDTLSTMANTQLDNHLNLIGSDELRDKLGELNIRLKDYYQISASNNQAKSMQVSSFIRDTLAIMYKDEIDQASDLSVCFGIMFRPDFGNNLLPGQFYTSLNPDTIFSNSSRGSVIANNSPIDLISGCLLNPSYVSMVADSISQKPVFALFKELAATGNQSHEREVCIQLMCELYMKQNRIGYYFLYYIYSVMLRLQLSTSAFTSLNANKSSKEETGPNAATNEFTSLIRIYREFIQERTHLAQTSINNAGADIDKVSSSSASPSSSSVSSSDSVSSSSASSTGGSESDSNLSVSDTDDDEKNASTSAAADSKDAAEKPVEFTPSELALGSCLMQDLRLCQQDDPYLFCFLLPFVCSSYLLPNYMINNSELVYLIVSCVDPRQMRDLRSSIVCQDLVLFKEPPNASLIGAKNKPKAVKSKKNNTSLQEKSNKKRKRMAKMSKRSKKSSSKKEATKSGKQQQKSKFKKESLFDVINTSLQWESLEQLFFWDLLCSHETISNELLLLLFNRLDANKHAEAIGFLFDILKCSEPSFELVKMVTMRRCEDNLTRSLLIAWARDGSNSEKMSKIFVNLLKMSMSSYNATSATGANLSGQNSGLKSTTMKKIKYNETLSSTNKVKLTALQQLEQHQKRNGSNSLSQDDWEKPNAMPSLDQVLSHLNKLRLNNTAIGFILTDKLLQMLRKVYQKCGDEAAKNAGTSSDEDNEKEGNDLRKKYADLFALAVDDYTSGGSQQQRERETSSRDVTATGDDDNDDDGDDNDDEDNDDNEASKRAKNTRKSSATPSKRASSGSKKRAGRPAKSNRKQESDEDDSNSGDEEKDDEGNNSDKDEEDSNDDDSSNDGFSRGKKGRKKNSSTTVKRSSAKSSAEKPPRKKQKQLKNSDNDSD